MNYSQVLSGVLYNLGKKGSGGNPDNAEVVAQMPMWFEEFQKEYQNDRNYWFMKAVAERNIDQTSQDYELPPGYKEGASLFIYDTMNDQFVELYPISDVDEIRLYNPSQLSGDKARPQTYALKNTSMRFYPWPDQTYTIRINYWGDLTLPDGTFPGFVNYWTDRFPTLCVRWLTARGFEYLQQWSSVDKWMAKVEKSIGDLRAENISRMLESDKGLRPRTSVYGNTYDSRNVGWISYYL